MAPILDIQNLDTHFYTYEGVVKALNHISLKIEHGATFGLVGESGCGKSVTVRSAMRIVQPPGKIEGGSILFSEDDKKDQAIDILKLSGREMEHLRGNRISMIFQEPNAALNPVMSIGDQVSESFLFHQKRQMCETVLEGLKKSRSPLTPLLTFLYRKAASAPDSPLLKLLSRIPLLSLWQRPLKKEAMSRSVEVLRQLYIPHPEEVVQRYPHNLSGGMKQRIVIAIALACDPVLLIADEATSNLDVTVQAQILDLLRELKKTRISSILLITHDLGVIAETCDRAGVMYAGSLCEVADVKDLFTNPRHPYTRALLNSVPKRDQTGKLASIEGAVPNLVSPPKGCRFHPRCPEAMKICKTIDPEPAEAGPGHLVACHLETAQRRAS